MISYFLLWLGWWEMGEVSFEHSLIKYTCSWRVHDVINLCYDFVMVMIIVWILNKWKYFYVYQLEHESANVRCYKVRGKLTIFEYNKSQIIFWLYFKLCSWIDSFFMRFVWNFYWLNLSINFMFSEYYKTSSSWIQNNLNIIENCMVHCIPMSLLYGKMQVHVNQKDKSISVCGGKVPNIILRKRLSNKNHS